MSPFENSDPPVKSVGLMLRALSATILIAALPALFGCSEPSINGGFCGMIPASLEAPLSYATFLHLGTMPDKAFLKEDQNRALRRIPPVEVREDPEAIQPLLQGRCAFSIFSGRFADSQKPLEGIQNAFLTSSDSTTYRVYWIVENLENEESRNLWKSYMNALWSDEFQEILPQYGMQPVPPEQRKHIREAINQPNRPVM